MSSGRGDFADLLWGDSSASKKSSANVTLGAALGQTRSAASSAQSNSRPFDTFAALASTGGSSKPSYGYSSSPRSGPSRNGTPLLPSESSNLASSSSTTNDAFGDLLGSAGSSSTSTANLSIAQRQAKLAEAALESERKRQQEIKNHGAFWDRFEHGATGVGETKRSPASQQASGVTSSKPSLTSSSLLTPTVVPSSSRPGSAAAVHAAKQPNAATTADIWGDFDDLSMNSAPSKPTASSSNAPPSNSLLSTHDNDDFLGFGEFQKPSSKTTTNGNAPRSSTPGDFDFGDREDYASGGLLGDDDNSDGGDDILGPLSQPTRTRSHERNQTSANPQSNSVPSKPSASRSTSPPPHIIGQIVEMGFTPQQARIALAATDTGVDVQAALDSLLNAGDEGFGNGFDDDGSGARRGRELTEEEEWERREEERERRRRGGSAAARSRQSAPTNGQQAESRAPRRSAAQSSQSEDAIANGDGDPSALLNAQQLREQADKVLAQASEIGLNVFNRANAFWSQGKAQLQKAYEERKAAPGAAGTASNGRDANGPVRPKWAQDDFGDEGDADLPPSSGGFKDEDDDGPEDPVARHPRQNAGPSSGRRAPPNQAPPIQTQARPRREEISLFDDEPKAYVSPARRRPGRDAISPSASQPASTPFASASSGGRRIATEPVSRAAPARPPSPLYKRPLVSASSSALAAAKTHRTQGTEMFKLGRYAEAQSLYSQALSALPDGHILTVVLLNNRAAASMKNGDHKGAEADCTAVLTFIEGGNGSGRKYHPTKEEPIPPLDDGEVISLADAYVKALQRRAQAYESGEKWEKARADWERLHSVDWPAGVRLRQEAVKSIGRCRKMLAGDSAQSQNGSYDSPSASASASARSSSSAPMAPTPRPKPKPKPKPVNLRSPAAVASYPQSGLGTTGLGAAFGTSGPADPNSSEGVSRLRAAADSQEAEDVERIRIKDGVDAKLQTWKGGKESNLRALIASLDTVLWAELGWTKVGMHELVTPNQVKIRYMKAIARVHPDKLTSMNTTVEQRMIANGVFGALNEAWNAFKP